MKQYLIEFNFLHLEHNPWYYNTTTSRGRHMATAIKDDAFVFNSWEEASSMYDKIETQIIKYNEDYDIKIIEL